ncbi:MAG: hypothetical protein RMJ19_02120, partial [Gemmatales bacterium]|nr:hypothetical protein [Gemmatales bacterium]MDW8174443.1 hypothetical protein [Gemmatales bacterium]
MLAWHENELQSVAFSRDGRHSVSRLDDGTIRISDVRTGRCVEVIAGRGEETAVASGTFPSAFIRHQEVDVESAAPAERLTRQLRLSTKCLFIFQPGLARDCRGHTT